MVANWKNSPAFDSLAQDAYVVGLVEMIKHIERMRPKFDVGFLYEALNEQRATLVKMNIAVGVS